MISANSLIQLVKQSLRVSTTVYDSVQLEHLIKTAQTDLGIAGVVVPEEYDDLIAEAVVTYCMLHFGIVDDYDKMKASYDEQKAQLMTATGYTDWGDANV